MSWKSLEEHVRSIATLTWGRPCVAEHIDGVNFDGVVRISDDEIILIEITEERDLAKVRADINKILPVKIQFGIRGVMCRAFIVLDGTPTYGMRETGRENRIKVLSSEEFEKEFFNFAAYDVLRVALPFGSAVDSKTGNNDSRSFIPVRYESDRTGKSLYVEQLAEKLAAGARIVLTGDFGTGKSRCVKELYGHLRDHIREVGAFPMAINLRDHWSSANAIEIIAGHLGNVGLSSSIDNVVKLLNMGALILLLDGFDEIGIQTHDMRVFDRKGQRRHAVRGIRDLIQRARSGILITGRSHFFDSDQEMLESIGLANPRREVEVFRAPQSFSSDEAGRYLQELGIVAKPPDWLPRKPLIFQILAELQREDIEAIFGQEFGEYQFWGAFIFAVCGRESRGVAGAISTESVQFILYELAAISRHSDTFLGRLTPKDIDTAYERAVGSSPDQAGMQLLARMCALGRIEPESPDRQFVDYNFIDVLRAECLVNDVANVSDADTNVKWRQPLRSYGIIHAASNMKHYDLSQQCFAYLRKYGSMGNSQKAAEVVAALLLFALDEIDFQYLQISNAEIPVVDTEGRTVRNLTLRNCILENLNLQDTKTKIGDNFRIEDCIVNQLYGIASGQGVPTWIVGTEIIDYEALSNAARIKETPVSPAQRLFLAIVHKIFFQAGSGREEAALLKGGYGQKYHPKTVEDILKVLMREGLVQRFKGDDGWVYTPVRKYAARLSAIRSELTLSSDPLWHEISALRM